MFRKNAHKGGASQTPTLERLEDRATPSVTVGKVGNVAWNYNSISGKLQIVGTDRADRIIVDLNGSPFINGTSLAVPLPASLEVIARGGNDWVQVNSPYGWIPAHLKGDSGDDTLIGGWGNDKIEGGHNNDVLDGRYGDDNLWGQDGADCLYGGWGNDKLVGGNGNDALLGEFGDDELIGENGNDYLAGGQGDDRLTGGKGNDKLYGNDGNDWFDAGSYLTLDNDLVDGGVGFDTATNRSSLDQMASIERFM